MMAALLITTLVWAAGLLAYGVLLRTVPAHGFRRAFLLLLAAVGILLPWLPVPRPPIDFLPSAPQLDQVWLDEIVITGAGESISVLPEFHWVVSVYFLGLILALIWMLHGVWRLGKFFGESRPVQTARSVILRVRETDQAMGPFSYGRTLFVSNWAAIGEEERRTLLRHETAHWRLGHRFDNLAMTALCTVVYFHPLAHILRKELRLVHEYQADQATLSCTSVTNYRRLLLSQQLTPNSSHLVAAFAQRPLQSRFDMMTQKFNTRQSWRLIGAAACLSLAVVACTKETVDEEMLSALDTAQEEGLSAEEECFNLDEAIASGEYELRSDTVETFSPDTYETTVYVMQTVVDAEGKVVQEFRQLIDRSGAMSELVRGQAVLKIAEDMPFFEGAGCALADEACHQTALLNYIYSNVTYPAKVRDAGVEGKVLVQFVIGTDGAVLSPKVVRSPHEALSEEVLRLVRDMPEWAPGKQDGKNVQVSFVLPVQFKLA